MNSKPTEIKKCRVCGNRNLVQVVDLGDQYLTGVFPKANYSGSLTHGPLRLVKCHGESNCCGLLQLQHSYDLAELYGENYGYRSGLNPSMSAHLFSKVKSLVGLNILEDGDLVIDIGSNDGTTLSAYPDNLKLIGVDPTAGKYREFYKENINVYQDFFTAKLIKDNFPNQKAKIVTSFSMFYDLEDPVDFAFQISDILDPTAGVWVFEQSYMPTMLDNLGYDTICHEHLEFYGLKQIHWIMQKADLKIIDVELNNINGGSFSVMVAKSECIRHSPQKNFVKLLHLEDSYGLSGLGPYLSFAKRIESNRKELRSFLSKASIENKSVCCLGASTKGNVLLQYCGITNEDVMLIGDINEDKHGAYTPGTLIPITDEQTALDLNTDYIIILPWHFRDYFIHNEKLQGRTLVFPLPSLEIIQL